MMPTMMRCLVGVVMIVAIGGTASAGRRDGDDPVNLRDEAGDTPADDKALAAARAFLKTLRGDDTSRVMARLDLPFSWYAAGTHGGKDAHCWSAERLIDEHEGLPGLPQCMSAVLGKHVVALDAALTPGSVMASLKAVEDQGGALPGPTRKRLLKLRHHRFVVAAIESPALRVVLALRKANGPVRVDGVLVAPLAPPAPVAK